MPATLTPKSATNARLTAEVLGRVQSVGFRYFVKTQARKLRLTGWVRNDAEGTVTVVAEGPREALERFAAKLEHGPDAADVEEVDVRWGPATGHFERFAIEA